MSEHYQRLDAPGFDYRLTPQPGLFLPVRGAPVDLERPFVACIGAAQTFGRFVARPFPEMLGEALGLPVLNMAVGGCGPKFYRQRACLQVLRRAKLVVAQVLSGRSASNSAWRTRDGGILGTVAATGATERLEPLLERMRLAGEHAEIERLVAESRAEYVRQFRALLHEIGVPSVLFWFASRSPDYVARCDSQTALMGDFPQLVDRATLTAIRSAASDYVELVSRTGLPQPLWHATEAVEGTRLDADGRLHNTYYPSPAMHVEAAQALLPVCRARLAVAPATSGSDPVATRPPAVPVTTFLILAAERTGSNLLADMLQGHPQVVAGGELFNPRVMDASDVPWPLVRPDERERLSALRSRDLVAFVDELLARGAASGAVAVGFKLLYSHAELLADRIEEIQEFRARHPDLRVVHLTRRNLFERFLSQIRAERSDVWQVRDPAQRPPAPAPIDIDVADLVADLLKVEAWQTNYRAFFAGHPLLELCYEELAADPQSVGRRVLHFLDVEPNGPLPVRNTKSSTEPIEQLVGNLDELRTTFRRWAELFTG